EAGAQRGIPAPGRVDVVAADVRAGLGGPGQLADAVAVGHHAGELLAVVGRARRPVHGAVEEERAGGRVDVHLAPAVSGDVDARARVDLGAADVLTRVGVGGQSAPADRRTRRVRGDAACIQVDVVAVGAGRDGGQQQGGRDAGERAAVSGRG